VLPSVDRLESFGLVQVEAMLRRVPVVACDPPGMRQPVARSRMGLLFQPGDHDDLGRAVAEILQIGPPSDSGPEQLERLFGHDAACAPYVDVLEAVGSGKPRKAHSGLGSETDAARPT
jgi:glycosyltransferase involved in cell wall biosynthesis